MTAAGVAGVLSERHARTTLPAVSAVYALDGAIGVYTHLRGVYRKPGGFHEATYNLVMGPPLLAPGSLLSAERTKKSKPAVQGEARGASAS